MRRHGVRGTYLSLPHRRAERVGELPLRRLAHITQITQLWPLQCIHLCTLVGHNTNVPCEGRRRPPGSSRSTCGRMRGCACRERPQMSRRIRSPTSTPLQHTVTPIRTPQLFTQYAQQLTKEMYALISSDVS